MSNTNPFVPKGSLLEQQSQRRSRLKLAVFCTVAIGVTGLVAMLIQGCKRDTDQDSNNLPPLVDNTNPPDMGTNGNVNPPIDSTNPVTPVPPINQTNPPPIVPMPAPIPPVTSLPPTEPTATGGSDYVIVAGDTLSKIAKKNGVSLKALQAANPGLDSRHLHVGKKVAIPAGGTPVAGTTPGVATPGSAVTSETAGGTVYVVKSGDTLHKIAKKFHVSVKAIESANHLSTATIHVGKKLKIPGKVEVAAPVPAPAPLPAPAPAPMPAPTSAPASAYTPVAPPVSTSAPAPAPQQ